MQKITPFLWFNKEAKEAADFYVSVFKGGSIKKAQQFDGTPSGTIDIITIEILGQEFTLMSAGPEFKFTEAVSFLIDCKDQKEIDYYWEALIADGGEESQCGWLKDKYGVSWQVVPNELDGLLAKSDKAMQAMLQMKKIDIETIKKAAE